MHARVWGDTGRFALEPVNTATRSTPHTHTCTATRWLPIGGMCKLHFNVDFWLDPGSYCLHAILSQQAYSKPAGTHPT
jgi:hypothetical protein